jgi:hypothetical protein
MWPPMGKLLSHLRALPWLRRLLWLVAALMVLLLVYLTIYHIRLSLQFSYYVFFDDRCVTIGPLGVEHHFRPRRFQWRDLDTVFCSPADFPAGVTRQDVSLLPSWWSWILPLIALAALMAFARLYVRQAARRGATDRRPRMAQRVIAIATLAVFAASIPEVVELMRSNRRLPSNYDGPRAEKVVRLVPPFSSVGGFAFVGKAAELADFGDDLEDNFRSPVLLFENNRQLGPAHSLHANIAAHGNGRFSHWGSSVIFSTSDGAAPDFAGRVYWLVLPKH